jgi:DNA replication protein DnaC
MKTTDEIDDVLARIKPAIVHQMPLAPQPTHTRQTEALAAANFPKRQYRRNATHSGQWGETFREYSAKVGRDGVILALVGERGSGKTQLATEIGRAALNSDLSVFYTTAMGFFLRLQSAMNSREDSVLDIIQTRQRPRILVIDEMQERGETPWEDRILTHLIDARYGAGKDTILIANQTPKAFAESVGTSIMRRLNETGGIIECNWEAPV